MQKDSAASLRYDKDLDKTDPKEETQPKQNFSYSRKPIYTYQRNKLNISELAAANLYANNLSWNHLNSSNKTLKHSSYFANVKLWDLSMKNRTEHTHKLGTFYNLSNIWIWIQMDELAI